MFDVKDKLILRFDLKYLQFDLKRI